MFKPKFDVVKTNRHGSPEVALVVRNSLYSPELRSMLEQLGYEPTPDIRNRRWVICTTPEQIRAASDHIKRFFDAKGNWK